MTDGQNPPAMRTNTRFGISLDPGIRTRNHDGAGCPHTCPVICLILVISRPAPNYPCMPRDRLPTPKTRRAHPADAGHITRDGAVCRCNVAANMLRPCRLWLAAGRRPAGLGRAGLLMWAAFYGDQWQKQVKTAVSARHWQNCQSFALDQTSIWAMAKQMSINQRKFSKTNIFLLQQFPATVHCPGHQGFPLHGSVQCWRHLRKQVLPPAR